MPNTTDSRCRYSYDALHVHYTVLVDEAEPEHDLESINGTIKDNYTNVAITPGEFPDGVEEFDWLIEFDQTPRSLAFVQATQGCDPLIFQYSQYLDETTLRQLADMFLTAAIRMRERDHKEDILDAKAKAMIQELPFGEEQEQQ